MIAVFERKEYNNFICFLAGNLSAYAARKYTPVFLCIQLEFQKGQELESAYGKRERFTAGSKRS